MQVTKRKFLKGLLKGLVKSLEGSRREDEEFARGVIECAARTFCALCENKILVQSAMLVIEKWTDGVYNGQKFKSSLSDFEGELCKLDEPEHKGKRRCCRSASKRRKS